MDGFLKVVGTICEVFGNFVFLQKKRNKSETLPPIPGEQYILLMILIILSLGAFLLHFIIKMDPKTYLTMATLSVTLLTLIFFDIVRKFYYYHSLKELKRNNNVKPLDS